MLGTELHSWEELEALLTTELSLQPQDNFNMTNDIERVILSKSKGMLG